MAKEQPLVEQLTIWEDAQQMLTKARREGIETAWDRYAAQSPHCTFCELGLICKNCNMGPCRISPKEGGKMQRGVCGADAHVIVARNFGRFVAGGAAGHSDHGRDLIEVLEAITEGHTTAYRISDEAKLRRVAAELAIAVEEKSINEVATALVEPVTPISAAASRRWALFVVSPRCASRSGAAWASCRAVWIGRSPR